MARKKIERLKYWLVRKLLRGELITMESKAVRELSMRISQLEAENAELRKSKNLLVELGKEGTGISDRRLNFN